MKQLILAAIAFIYFPAASFSQECHDYNPYNYDIPDYPDPGYACSDINLSFCEPPEGAYITRVKIYYEIRHTCPWDLEIWLTTFYDGSWHDLYLYGQGDLPCDPDDVIETRDNIHAFDGGSPDGEWFLCVKDLASGDVGYIDFFEIWVYYDVNDAPNTPYNPDPNDDEEDVSITTDLDWDCSDPNGDEIYYTVYFEKNDSSPDDIIKDDSPGSYADPGTLDYDSHYYWQVIADDHHGGVTEGDVWHFYTEEEPIYNAEIQWGDVENEIYYEGEMIRLNVQVKNTGNTILSGLWLNVDISDPGGNNVREGWWQDIPTLYPNETYTTGYDNVWSVPCGSDLGEYEVTVGLKDDSNIYDIEYNIDQFEVDIIEEPFPDITGRIIFHSYSHYDNWDGKLYLLDFSDRSLTEVSENWNIDHTINAHFSPDGSKIVFMGVPEGSHYGNSWDLYLWGINDDIPENLTEGNEIRDEDPKFSPDGNKIVFKQNGDLKEMDLDTYIINEITSDGMTIEEGMPFYTTDGQRVVYARGADNASDIYWININGSGNDPLENVSGLAEYYPITRDESTFLYTRWVSLSNQNDQIYLGYFSGDDPFSLPFCCENTNDSDPYPVGTEYVLFSSTRSGQGGYDLFLADFSGTVWSLDDFNVNSSVDDLGICYSDVETSLFDNIYGEVPAVFSLSQNHPNPFNISTTIRYSLSEQSIVTIDIYDILGQKVETLTEEEQPTGYHQATWDASDHASGIYFYRIQAGEYAETRKMVLLK